MKERIIEVLTKELGFKIIEEENGNVSFSYEDYKYTYIPDKENPFKINIAMPDMFTEKLDNLYYVSGIINNNIGFCKSYVIEENIWLVYERIYFETESLKDVLTHMISQIYLVFYHLKRNNCFLEDTNDESIMENNENGSVAEELN